MPKHVLQITDAEVKFADTEAGLTAAESFGCQVIAAAITSSPVTSTVPATFCEGETDITGKTKFSLDLRYLQDWDQPAGLSKYLYDNDAAVKWFSIALTAETEPLAVGQVSVVAGQYGGDAGGALEGSVTMPCQGKPVVTTPAAVP